MANNRELIEREFELAYKVKSDINEHINVLFQKAAECNHVTEFGVRYVVSTWAFLNADAKVVSYDIHKSDNVDYCKAVAPEWTFIEADTLNVDIEQTDLLFIDTLHTYEQLKAELTKHHSKVNKYIILHDTITYGTTDEPTSRQTPEIMANYKVNEKKKGLQPALLEFLNEHPEWQEEITYTNNNGLTILKKK